MARYVFVDSSGKVVDVRMSNVSPSPYAASYQVPDDSVIWMGWVRDASGNFKGPEPLPVSQMDIEQRLDDLRQRVDGIYTPET